MNTNTKLTLTAASLLMTSIACHAAALVEYDWSGTSSLVDPTGATAGNWQTLFGGISGGSRTYYNTPLNDTKTDFGTFTVTADAGNLLNLDSFTFDYATYSFTVSSASFVLDVSVNGTPVYTSGDVAGFAGGYTDFLTTLDLSSTGSFGNTFQGLSAATVTFAVTSTNTEGINNPFRLITSSSTGEAAGTWPDKTNMLLQGTVIPEPSTLGLAALSGLGLIAIRRRKFML